jgi:membrane protease YdiL (CAAX protease family)
MFEECIFRGVIFSILASRFTKDRNGFWTTYLFSSGVFAIAHLFNGLSFGTILQVGYTFLTGGLFAFVLIKTKNLLCCGLVHAIYNFCGLLFETPERMGLGSGVVFDLGTVLTMLIVSVCIGLFVLVSVYKYSDEERGVLYQKLGVKE